MSLIVPTPLEKSPDGHMLENQKLSKNVAANPCPDNHETNLAIMEDFLTISEWESARQETNTDHLTTSQISVLQSPDHDTVCEALNSSFQGVLDEEWPDDNTKKYNVSYYKAGDYFFVIISLRQPDDPDLVATGVAYLTVYDSNINKIKAYAF